MDNIYLYKEESARANVLFKHIRKFNQAARINQVVDLNFDTDTNTDININIKSYYFILNEKGIQSFHNSSNSVNSSANDSDNLNYVFPTLEQSYLETSKLYCRQFLNCVGLEYLNPAYVVLTKETNLDEVKFTNRVIKADGLASGKGVFVFGDHFKTDNEAIVIVQGLLGNHERILLEEKLEGEEFSCITLSWKGVMTHFPLVKDFKRLEDGDNGPNTGGMGTISFAGGSMPFLEASELEHCRSINETVIIETHFRGFLYGSFMKTRDGKLKIIEYNVRLGDSEAINILELLESSLLDHLEDPRKNPLQINTNENTYFRYLVPKDYARMDYNIMDNNVDIESRKKRKNLYYLVDTNMPINDFYLANSNYVNIPGIDGLYTIGTSRTCGVLSRGIDISEMVKENDRLVRMIYGDLHYRSDIGRKMIDMIEMGGVNYIGHLDNYNHIITDVKKKIDTHNLEVEKANLHLGLGLELDLKVLGRIGDFANSVKVGTSKIICSVDGAGTKTKFLEGHPHRFNILGKDIVIHNINDMFCNNGHPIALLDYYGCDKLDKNEFAQFINGALDICREHGIALIGGETAEMRGIFQSGEVEVLGILLGILEGDTGPENGVDIKAGHFIYGLESHGAHTNGFTKLREIDSRVGMPNKVKEFFSQPHKCYINVVNHLENVLNELNNRIVGKAHITGGGFCDNIERILPGELGLKIALERWKLGEEWEWLFNNGGMEWDEFIRVFNAGWGFCVVVEKEIPERILEDIENEEYGKIKRIGCIC